MADKTDDTKPDTKPDPPKETKPYTSDYIVWIGPGLNGGFPGMRPDGQDALISGFEATPIKDTVTPEHLQDLLDAKLVRYCSEHYVTPTDDEK